MSLKIGDTIDDKYRIVRLIGEGGMGAVYEGENTRIARRVAIKILHANVASSEDAVQRFEREAQAAGRIGSDHIVEVLDLGELPDGDRYMVMEYLDGEALNERIARKGKLAPQVSARIVVEMLEGLKAAHAAGIIHRDLKPDNVFLLSSRAGRKDFVKVVDFGISKFSTLGGEFSMTQTGAVMGTPYYLSPEQAKGERNVDLRSDLYAVGVILWEATVGRVPFEGETFNQLLFKIVLEPVPKLAEMVPDLDPTFVQIVEKAMARDPDDRFASAEELQGALCNWLAGQPIPEEALEIRSSRVSLDHSALTGTGVTAGTINRTNGNWANTNPEDAAQKKKSRTPLLVAAAAVLLLGGGGALYANSLKVAEEAAALARADKEAEQRAEEQERLAELARLETERAQAAADRALAEKEKSEAEKARAEAQLSATEQARKLAEEQEAKEQEEARRRAAIAAAAARRARAASAAEAPAPAPAPRVAPSSGRKIRTEL